jgi:hypothetical protein
MKTIPEMGIVRCGNCVGLMAQDDLRLSPSEYGEAQVSARRTGVTSLDIQETGANLGHRAGPPVHVILNRHRRIPDG